MISKFLVGRKTSEVVENADESSFGEGQDTDSPRFVPLSLLLAGPDRSRADSARGHALLLTLLRLSLRVAEVCSLRARPVKWSHGRGIIKFKVKGGPERTLPPPARHF